MRTHVQALVVTATLLCAAGAFPLEAPALAPGARVRVSSPSLGAEPVVGTLVRQEDGALWVDRGPSGSPTRIALEPVTRIEVSAGRRTRATQGALVGLAAGAVPGLLLTFGDYDSDDDPSPGAVAAVGAASGAALGAAIGWALKTEEWLPAERPAVAASITPLRGGGLGVSLRVSWGGAR